MSGMFETEMLSDDFDDSFLQMPADPTFATFSQRQEILNCF